MAILDAIVVKTSRTSDHDLRKGENYIYDALPPENVFGHTKKVRLLRDSIERLRRRSGRGSLRILDIGCGSGYAVTRFLSRQGDQVLGIDMYPPNINYAATHFGHNGLRFICMDADSLSADGETFDIVVMADILEHLDNPMAILATAAELMVPNGILLVTVPNGKGPFELESAFSRVPLVGSALLSMLDLSVALLKKFVLGGISSRNPSSGPSDLPYNIDSGHVQFFSMAAMVRLFSETGLEVIGSRNLSFLCGPFTNSIFSRWQSFCDWNVSMADHLPSWLSSAWFFECRKTSDRD